MSDAPRRRAHVGLTDAGWVVRLAGGSVSKPFPTWADAFGYAYEMTALYCWHWFHEKPGRL